MKNLKLLLLFLTISLSFSEDCPKEPNGNDDELDECKELKVDTGNHCCLLSYDLGTGELGSKGSTCISITSDEYADRNKAITRLQTDPQYAKATGTILCDGDKTGDAIFTALKITKSFLCLLLILL